MKRRVAAEPAGRDLSICVMANVKAITRPSRLLAYLFIVAIFVFKEWDCESFQRGQSQEQKH